MEAPIYYLYTQMAYFVNINFYCLIFYLLIRQHTIESLNNNTNDKNKCIVKSPRH